MGFTKIVGHFVKQANKAKKSPVFYVTLFIDEMVTDSIQN